MTTNETNDERVDARPRRTASLVVAARRRPAPSRVDGRVDTRRRRSVRCVSLCTHRSVILVLVYVVLSHTLVHKVPTVHVRTRRPRRWLRSVGRSVGRRRRAGGARVERRTREPTNGGVASRVVSRRVSNVRLVRRETTRDARIHASPSRVPIDRADATTSERDGGTTTNRATRARDRAREER